MATVVICDRCRNLGEPAHKVACSFVKTEYDGRGREKSRPMIQPKFELCESCITHLMRSFGKFSQLWLGGGLVFYGEDENQWDDSPIEDAEALEKAQSQNVPDKPF